MTGADVKRIRDALGHAIGRRLSQSDLGLMLGLSDDNAARLVRKWEDEEPSGPAALALELLALAVDGSRFEDRVLEAGVDAARGYEQQQDDEDPANDPYEAAIFRAMMREKVRALAGLPRRAPQQPLGPLPVFKQTED